MESAKDVENGQGMNRWWIKTILENFTERASIRGDEIAVDLGPSWWKYGSANSPALLCSAPPSCLCSALACRSLFVPHCHCRRRCRRWRSWRQNRTCDGRGNLGRWEMLGWRSPCRGDLARCLTCWLGKAAVREELICASERAHNVIYSKRIETHPTSSDITAKQTLWTGHDHPNTGFSGPRPSLCKNPQSDEIPQQDGRKEWSLVWPKDSEIITEIAAAASERSEIGGLTHVVQAPHPVCPRSHQLATVTPIE